MALSRGRPYCGAVCGVCRLFAYHFTMKTTQYSSATYVFLVGVIGALAVFLSVPYLAHAATYAYINTSGTFSYIEASSAEDALARASNRHASSGVMTVETASGAQQATALSGYVYVNTSGQVVRVSAQTAAEAFAIAQNIAPNSGVMPIDSVEDSTLVGDRVAGV